MADLNGTGAAPVASAGNVTRLQAAPRINRTATTAAYEWQRSCPQHAISGVVVGDREGKAVGEQAVEGGAV